jgi:predicted deacylase
MKFGSLTVKKGEKVQGKIKVTELADGTSVKVPITVISGNNEGPILYTQSACHGVEINGTEAIRQMIDQINPKKLSGTFVTIPIVNILAARNRLTWTPVELDYEFGNMNRTWPGNKDGSLTERMSYTIFEEVIKKVDIVIDHHTGSMPTINWIYFYEGDNEQKKLALNYGTKYLVAEKAGTDEWKKKRFYGKLRVVCLEQLGIPAICPELDGRDHLDKDAVKVGVRGIKNIMRYFKMIEGEIELPEKQYITTNTEFGYVKANRGGWFLPSVEVGNQVEANQKIGTIYSILDGFDEIEKIFSPRDGIVHSLNKSPIVWPGVRISRIDKIIEEINN